MAGAVLGAVIAAIANVGIVNGVIMTTVFAVVACVLWVTGSIVMKKQKSAASQKKWEQQQAAQRRGEASQALVNDARRAVQQAELAVNAFQEMPTCLGQIDSLVGQAKKCRADRAFSPFWSAIERAYVAAGAYRSRVGSIEQSARAHADAVASYTANGGDPRSFAQFPVKLDGGAAESAIAGRIEELGRLVYDAQRESTFATIWEQRRTTSAVVQGFGSLEDAVERMASSTAASFAALTVTVKDSQSIVADAVSRSAPTASSVGQPQSESMAALTRTAERIHNELFRQGHGRYPMI
jgi:hypothetical protein